MLEFVIPCLLGLESLVGDEIKKLGLSDVRVENGRVLCRGEARDIARLNINLRCGARVILVLHKFRATDFESLFQGVRAVHWEDWIPREGEFPVVGYSINSTLHSVPACQSIVKKAVVDRLSAAYGIAQFPETGRRYQVRFSIMKDEVTVGLDTSGEGLYKRGYRAQGVAAPLKETLAAAMVKLSHYNGRDPFCDPFCGSGTIAIEAALIARNRAPGLNRSFAAQHWATLDKMLWLDAADEAMDKEFHGKYEIWGGDIDPDAVELSRHNAELAEVDDIVKFEVDDATRFHWGGLYGRIVTNPPYGERLLEREEAGELYKAFGKAMDKLPDTWRVYVLSSHPDFERCYGRFADKKRKLYNGPLNKDAFACGLMQEPASFYYGVMWNKLYRADIVREHPDVRCNEELDYSEDLYFNLSFIRYAQQFYALSTPIYNYVQNPDSAVHHLNPFDVLTTRFELTTYYKDLFKHIGLYEENKYRLNKFFFGVAES